MCTRAHSIVIGADIYSVHTAVRCCKQIVILVSYNSVERKKRMFIYFICFCWFLFSIVSRIFFAIFILLSLLLNSSLSSLFVHKLFEMATTHPNRVLKWYTTSVDQTSPSSSIVQTVCCCCYCCCLHINCSSKFTKEMKRKCH